MLENALVGLAVLERHENALIHHAIHPLKMRTRSHALKAAIETATMYASAFNQSGLTNSPIFRRSDVNRTSGNTANESCRLRITWLRSRRWAAPCAPKKLAGSAAGAMAVRRM